MNQKILLQSFGGVWFYPSPALCEALPAPHKAYLWVEQR